MWQWNALYNKKKQQHHVVILNFAPNGPTEKKNQKIKTTVNYEQILIVRDFNGIVNNTVDRKNKNKVNAH